MLTFFPNLFRPKPPTELLMDLFKDDDEDNNGDDTSYPKPIRLIDPRSY